VAENLCSKKPNIQKNDFFQEKYPYLIRVKKYFIHVFNEAKNIFTKWKNLLQKDDFVNILYEKSTYKRS
jgi:hypothetical protein